MRSILKHAIMAASRRRRLLLYGGFLLALGVACLQVTYFSEGYRPLQVLTDAQSEARRLLKFITLYHYQCNVTMQGLNVTMWPVCLEKAGGLNLVLGGPRVMFSIGPSGDLSLERTLAVNFSYQVNIFHHQIVSPEQLGIVGNNTRVYRTIIVPNDPSDYGRNSYESQTVNNVFDVFKTDVLDVLKVDTLADMDHSHELIYYMVKDRLLANVRQLHFALYIDKVDDDYLYSWYRALYMLFHTAGFRLYHTTASDGLCLQVTLMESCVYFLSWTRDPGPDYFILYPPAIDGSDEFETDRLQDYMEDVKASCYKNLELSLPSVGSVSICLDKVEAQKHKPCQFIIFRGSGMEGSTTRLPDSRCTVTTLEVSLLSAVPPTFRVYQHSYERTVSDRVYLEDALQKYMQSTFTNLVLVDMGSHLWSFLTSLLDSGALYNVDQLMLNIHDLWGGHKAVETRRSFSELMRVEAYGFRKYKIGNDKLTFHSEAATNSGNVVINYLKTEAGRISE
ncbi:uncharacterized protein LOC127873875 [Dreissena polymorpha]|uniref:Uncharacterized protein n=1 Tax=Dreissena polymorpha TaxID=45954 RepID=A0A9D4L008_DREPO|nr:uncharacterized protein LOC127873875 [Dreissena polymorpha]KAH3848232.1 hypothetical protein DPMN_090591 [Dreissena polymorpha]